MSDRQVRALVWGENIHEQVDPVVQQMYPEGMHTAIAGGIREYLGDAATVRTATFLDPGHGLTQEAVDATDVLIWWSHTTQNDVHPAIVDRLQARVLAGMGLVVLHSGHYSAIFRKLMGTHCTLRWREADDREIIWTVNPSHPIAAGVKHGFVIPRSEMYGEIFDIPVPDELVFISSYSGGEVFRSGCCFRRGKGRVFYFSPGHEHFPIYHQPEIRRIIANAVRWAHQSELFDYDLARIYQSRTGWFEAGSATAPPPPLHRPSPEASEQRQRLRQLIDGAKAQTGL
ncbi:MAG: ThuA domain-containing protein [Chloroflexi bacterium]|nr:ThuA domain-containing protein [Chloroflexota bacterium]